jgi:hypothetical protein
MRSAFNSGALPGSGRPIVGRNRSTIASKGLADAPQAIGSVRVDVVEHPQQARAARRVGRESVDVQPAVVLPPARDPAFEPHRPERRVAGAGPARVVREEPLDERLRRRAVTRDHRLQRGLVGGVPGAAAERGRAGAQGDVLGFAVRPARVEEAAFLGYQLEAQAREAQHAARLEFALERPRGSSGFTGAPGDVRVVAQHVRLRTRHFRLLEEQSGKCPARRMPGVVRARRARLALLSARRPDTCPGS